MAYSNFGIEFPVLVARYAKYAAMGVCLSARAGMMSLKGFRLATH
jgi:hypothetical protein